MNPTPAIGQRWKCNNSPALIEIIALNSTTWQVRTLTPGKCGWFEFKTGELYSFDFQRFLDVPTDPKYRDITFEYLSGQDAPV